MESVDRSVGALGSNVAELSPPLDGSEFDLFPDLCELTLPSSCEDQVRVVMGRNGEDDELISYMTGKLNKDVEAQSEGNSFVSDEVMTKKFPCNYVTQGGNTKHIRVIRVENKSAAVVSPNNENERTSTMKSSSYDGTTLCMSKNAVAARENRLKKKQYVEHLQSVVDHTKKENVTLKQENTSLKEQVENLTTEVNYLRSVLANQSMLASLLHNIPKIPGVSLKTSETSRKIICKKRPAPVDESLLTTGHEGTTDCRDKENINIITNVITTSQSKQQKLEDTITDHCYATKETGLINFATQSVKPDESSPGVCLHVSGSNVSLEFCSVCSLRAGVSTSIGIKTS